MTDASHRIIIDLEPFGAGYDVKVEPAVPGFSFDAEYPDHKSARTYARGLRLHRGWPIDDRTGEGGA